MEKRAHGHTDQALPFDIREMLGLSFVSLAFRLDFVFNERMRLDGLRDPLYHSSASWSEPNDMSLSTPTLCDYTRYFMVRGTKWRLSGSLGNQHQLG